MQYGEFINEYIAIQQICTLQRQQDAMITKIKINVWKINVQTNAQNLYIMNMKMNTIYVYNQNWNWIQEIKHVTK